MERKARGSWVVCLASAANSSYPHGILILEPSFDSAACCCCCCAFRSLSKPKTKIDSDSFRASARSTHSRNKAGRMSSIGSARSALLGSFRRPDRFDFARACYSGAVRSSRQTLTHLFALRCGGFVRGAQTKSRVAYVRAAHGCKRSATRRGSSYRCTVITCARCRSTAVMPRGSEAVES